MSIFENITLEWGGKQFVVPSNRVMGAIARVEEVVTLKELSEFAQAPGGAKFAKLAMAYGTLLRYAGAKIEDEEIYRGLFRRNDDQDVSSTLYASISGLLAMMVPPDVLTSGVSEEETPSGGKSTPAAARSSQRPTKQRSESGGSSQVSSGGSLPKSSGG